MAPHPLFAGVCAIIGTLMAAWLEDRLNGTRAGGMMRRVMVLALPAVIGATLIFSPAAWAGGSCDKKTCLTFDEPPVPDGR
jgi:sugar phosphate permease